MITLGHDRAHQLARSCEQEFTYPEVGLTRSSVLPVGYRHDRVEVRIGQGELDWERADDLPTKLAGPIARKIQEAATERYLTGFRKHVAEMT